MRATTDNFLSFRAGRGSYQPRPTAFAQQRAPIQSQPVVFARTNDVLPPQPTQLLRVSEQSASPFEQQIVASSWQQKKHAIPALASKKMFYALALLVVVLGVPATVAALKSGDPPAAHAKTPSVAAAAKIVPAATPVQPVQSGIGQPVRLKIPSINVDTTIEHVGLTSEGDMGAPEGPNNVGWYQPGPRPGQKGSAVIDGHFGYKNHIPAVFDNLHTLQKGDLLHVVDETGMTTIFMVRETRTYGPDEDASDVFTSTDTRAHLNLVTCKGAWSKSQKSYATRLVVFADQEAAQAVPASGVAGRLQTGGLH